MLWLYIAESQSNKPADSPNKPKTILTSELTQSDDLEWKKPSMPCSSRLAVAPMLLATLTVGDAGHNITNYS
jgi:hypothetical protein